jgi:hypothetical protein
MPVLLNAKNMTSDIASGALKNADCARTNADAWHAFLCEFANGLVRTPSY